MAKRGPGEGTITQRKDGRWEARISLGGSKRKCYYAASYEDALKKLTAARNDQQQGIPIVADERQTLKQFLEFWLENVIKPKRRLSTYVSYRQQVRVHIEPALGRLQLTKITTQHIEHYLNEKAKRLSPKTRKYHLSILRMALRKAMKWDLIKRNVATLVDTPTVERYEARPLSLEEAADFLKAIEADRLRAFYTLLLLLGLRKGEALAATWDDIDFDKREINITKTLSRLEGKLVVDKPKTKRSNRVVALSDLLVFELQQHRRRQLEERLAVGDKWKDSGYVFTTRVGSPICPRKINRLMTKLLKTAGIEHRRVHDLRHSFATLCLAEEMPSKVVSDVMGHSSTRITEDLYQHVLKELGRKPVDLLSSRLSSNAR